MFYRVINQALIFSDMILRIIDERDESESDDDDIHGEAEEAGTVDVCENIWEEE